MELGKHTICQSAVKHSPSLYCWKTRYTNRSLPSFVRDNLGKMWHWVMTQCHAACPYWMEATEFQFAQFRFFRIGRSLTPGNNTMPWGEPLLEMRLPSLELGKQIAQLCLINNTVDILYWAICAGTWIISIGPDLPSLAAENSANSCATWHFCWRPVPSAVWFVEFFLTGTRQTLFKYSLSWR